MRADLPTTAPQHAISASQERDRGDRSEPVAVPHSKFTRNGAAPSVSSKVTTSSTTAPAQIHWHKSQLGHSQGACGTRSPSFDGLHGSYSQAHPSHWATGSSASSVRIGTVDPTIWQQMGFVRIRTARRTCVCMKLPQWKHMPTVRAGQRNKYSPLLLGCRYGSTADWRARGWLRRNFACLPGRVS